MAFVGAHLLRYTAFTCLRVYGIWGKDWKPLLIVVPLAIVKPFVSLVSTRSRGINTKHSSSSKWREYEAFRYIPAQAGPPFGCVYIYTLSDSVLTKYVHRQMSLNEKDLR